MAEFQGFDNQNNGAGTAGLLSGIVLGIGTFLFGIREWWKWGWGAWSWADPEGKSDTIHAYWLAFWGHLIPTYKGDFGTWWLFSTWLHNHHKYDSFVASFWVPFIIGSSVGILTAWFVVRASNRQRKNFLRGSRTHQGGGRHV